MRGYGYGYGMMGGNWFTTLLTIAIWAILIIAIVLLIVWATRMARHGGGHLAHGGPHGTMMAGPRPPADRVVPPRMDIVPPPGQSVPPVQQQPMQQHPMQPPMHQQQPMQPPMHQQQPMQPPMHQPQPIQQQPHVHQPTHPTVPAPQQPAMHQPMAGRPASADEAIAIARRRLASGEISRGEFDDIMAGLRGTGE